MSGQKRAFGHPMMNSDSFIQQIRVWPDQAKGWSFRKGMGVSQFKVCMLESAQFEIAYVIALQCCPKSPEVKAYSKYILKMCTLF